MFYIVLEAPVCYIIYYEIIEKKLFNAKNMELYMILMFQML